VTVAGRRRRPGCGERGSATVLALGLCLALGLLTVAGCALLTAVVASHRARAAADLSALAAAQRWLDGAPADLACAEARRVAGVNGATVRDCAPVADSVTVIVVVPAGRLGPALARARAGPAPETAG